MSIPFSGCRTRSGGIISAIAKQVKLVNLKPLDKITVRFDPFHNNVKETRDFLFYISGKKVAVTNVMCQLKTEISCDLSDPVITCNYSTGDKLILKSSNLTALELLKVFNKHVSSTVKKEEVPETPKKIGKKK